MKIARAIAEMKREDKTWKKLQEHWPEASSPKDDDRSKATNAGERR